MDRSGRNFAASRLAHAAHYSNSRYEHMLQMQQQVAREQMICGSHVHVGINDRELHKPSPAVVARPGSGKNRDFVTMAATAGLFCRGVAVPAERWDGGARAGAHPDLLDQWITHFK
ncbi:MAG: hypothetical protein LC776_00270 [Acidobacteria bacterium]|nr:hypothetical protein [Acidobacteriota bacterium]